MSLRSWYNVFSNRRARAEQALREQGFNYAAGELLRGKTVQEVEAKAYDAFHQNEFNYGMQSALSAWDPLNREGKYSPRARNTCPKCKATGEYIGTQHDDHHCESSTNWETQYSGFISSKPR